jgi:hypothetical protein
MDHRPIDFADASKEWLANKRRKGSMYIYTCDHTYQNGRRCGRDVYKAEPLCRQHWALEENRKKAEKTEEN